MSILHVPEFAEHWLSDGAVPLSTETLEELSGTPLRIASHFWHLCERTKAISELLKEAQKNGFPPLPAAASVASFWEMKADRTRGFGYGKPLRNFWENLQGEHIWGMFLYGFEAPWFAGAEHIRCKHLLLKDFPGAKCLDRLPRLEADHVNSPPSAQLTINRIAGMSCLGEGTESYLGTIDSGALRLCVSEPGLRSVDSQWMRFMSDRFEIVDLWIGENSLPPYFMDEDPVFYEMLLKGDLAVVFGKNRYLKTRAAKQIGGRSFYIETETPPPFRKGSLLEGRKLGVLSAKDGAGASGESQRGRMLAW